MAVIHVEIFITEKMLQASLSGVEYKSNLCIRKQKSKWVVLNYL